METAALSPSKTPHPRRNPTQNQQVTQPGETLQQPMRNPTNPLDEIGGRP